MRDPLEQGKSQQVWMAPKREIFGFALFDFANSAYTTVIVTVLFGNVFWFYIVGDQQQGNWLWSLALGISYLLVVLAAPILGAFMDVTGGKKKYLVASCLLTVIATSALYFVEPGTIVLAMVLICISNFGFSMGEIVVSSYLPELGSRDQLGKISGYAWGLGYFGGISSTLLAMWVTGFGATEGGYELKRLIGPITGMFFLFAAIPTFVLLRERRVPVKLPAGVNVLSSSFTTMKTTLAELPQFRDLSWFLCSYFFAYSGLAIVISFAFIYGEQVIGLAPGQAATMFVVLNLASAMGALVFGHIQSKFGDKWTYNLTLVIWIFAVVLTYKSPGLTQWINTTLSAEFSVATVFMACGGLSGICLGATQSASRAMTGVLSPSSKAGQFFGLWGLTTKLAAAVGLITYGLFQLWVGVEMSILLCGGFFAIGLLINLMMNEPRGVALAASWDDQEHR